MLWEYRNTEVPPHHITVVPLCLCAVAPLILSVKSSKRCILFQGNRTLLKILSLSIFLFRNFR